MAPLLHRAAITTCSKLRVSVAERRVSILTSEMWLHQADWTTTGLLLMLLLWQRVSVSESGCVSDKCFCFDYGLNETDIECADIYLRRMPKFTNS